MSMKKQGISYYPLALNLKGKPVILIGGGEVAERKVLSLLQAESAIKIVSPSLTRRLRELTEAGKIKWISRKVRKIDLLESELVIAATDDSNINNRVSLWAKERGALVNVVDRPVLSTFISPAIFRRGKAIIAVYTNGSDPILSRDLKNFLKENWGEFVSYRKRLQKR